MTVINELKGTTVNQYKIIRLIGTGAYGLVFLVEDYYTHKQYAIKALAKKVFKRTQDKQSDLLLKSLIRLSSDYNGVLTNLNTVDLVKLRDYDINRIEAQKVQYLKELCIHLKVHDHPNVITIHEIIDSPTCLFIVMDYFQEGDLFQNIVDKQIYINSTPSVIKSVFIQLIDVISYCHSKGIYHCDLKPENIMCDSDGKRLIIGDFGLSVTEKNINVKTCIGSSYYMPPERLITANNNLDYDSNATYPADKGDIWSLCIILINLTCMRNPWMKACAELDHTYNNYLKDSKVLKEILSINDQLYEILKDCLKEDPFARLTLFELREEISKCDTFTKTGPLSIPDPEEYIGQEIPLILSKECLIPQDDVNQPTTTHPSMHPIGSQRSHKQRNSRIDKINHKYLHLFRNSVVDPIADKCFDPKSFKYVNSNNNVIDFFNKNHDQLMDDENYSTLTNKSFHLNEGYFGGNTNGYLGCFGVK